MASYELKVSILGGPDHDGGDVRAWIDRNLSGNLSSERELKLKRERACWSARFQIRVKDCKRFAFRVGLVAESGALWQVSIRECAVDQVVFEDSDVLVDAKQWLLGTCDVVEDEAALDERIERQLTDSLHWLGHNLRSVLSIRRTEAID